jgi:hypothetical protein
MHYHVAFQIIQVDSILHSRPSRLRRHSSLVLFVYLCTSSSPTLRMKIRTPTQELVKGGIGLWRTVCTCCSFRNAHILCRGPPFDSGTDHIWGSVSPFPQFPLPWGRLQPVNRNWRRRTAFDSGLRAMVFSSFISHLLGVQVSTMFPS